MKTELYLTNFSILLKWLFFLKAAEQVHEITNLQKGVEEDVVTVSHKVDEVCGA